MAYDRDIRDNAAMDALGANDPGANPRAEQILPGTPVFDAAGEKIGDVNDAGFSNGTLSMHQYGIFSRDLAIPMSAIARTDAGGVYLSVTKDQLRRDNTSRPPHQAPPWAASERPNDMATDAGSAHADLDVPPPNER